MDVNAIVTQLKIAKDFYYKGKPIMTDPQFDELEQKLRNLDPDNDYFKLVGAPVVRGEKVKHTIPMGSLDQVSTQDEAIEWMSKYPDELFIFSDKLDGNSIALYYDENGEFERAVTRGDGIEGLDVTRHIRRMFKLHDLYAAQIPSHISSSSGISVVRAEVIMKPELFNMYVTGYKNPRNYVAGQLNRSVADDAFIEHVSIIAFDADINNSKSYILDQLKNQNFKVVQYTEGNAKSIAMVGFENYLAQRKEESQYELDGIVIDIVSSSTRRDLGFDNLNPAYARKFKVNVNFVETEVVNVEWNPSKDGYLKPRVQFEPVDLAGVTISFATGFNAKFIKDNDIGKGAIIKVTRSGDVIPFIQEVIKRGPDGGDFFADWEDLCYWSDTGVDLILKEKPDESYIKEITEFFTSIDAPVLKLGNVTALYEAGFTTIAQIIKMTEDEMVVVLGENGFKAYAGLRDKLVGIQDYVLAGSLPFFGRGVGKRKMKVLAENHGDLTLLTYDKIIDTPGFDEITAVKIANAVDFYVDFIDDLADYVSREIYSRIEGELNGVVVCFTGVRSKELEDVIESNGGKVSSSVSKDLTHLVAKDPNGKSGKLDKARKSGVKIISLEEAKELWLV